ncbi:MAG: ATP-binding protein [Planctomycetes bacterium]|nr:ATP-binding protein [Planctomycetota bacterium]
MKTLSTPELAQRVAQELSAPEAQTRAVLDRAIEVMRKELQRGNRIELPQFLSLFVKTGQAVSTKGTTNPSVNLPPARLVQFDLDESLRKKIEGSGQYQILLVVPRKNFFTGVMAARLSSVRSEVTVIDGESNAITFLEKHHPDLIVLDVGLGEPSKVCEFVKKRKETSLTAIIRVYAEGEDPAVVKGVQSVADETIIEPFELTDLVKLTESELARFAEERNYFEHEMHFKVQSGEDHIEIANDLVAGLLAQSGLTEESGSALGVAFREALDNGNRHGNKMNEKRHVDIQYIVDREKVTLAVTDEGDGFDTEIYLSRGVSGNPVDAARERNLQGGAGGLGIMLMLKCVDKLEYNYAGNKITLTKYIRKT